MAAPDTPSKTCAPSDICVLCGFSFIEYEKKENGEHVLHKHFDRKLRFNNERQENVYKVTGINFSENSAVCFKCYRSVDSVLKSEQKNKNMKEQICSKARQDKLKKHNYYNFFLPKTITKRMLRSPVITLSAKKDKALNIETVQYKPVYIAPFKEITNTITNVTNKPKIVHRSLEFQDPQVNQGEIEGSKEQKCSFFLLEPVYNVDTKITFTYFNT